MIGDRLVTVVKLTQFHDIPSLALRAVFTQLGLNHWVKEENVKAITQIQIHHPKYKILAHRVKIEASTANHMVGVSLGTFHKPMK